MTEQSSGDDRAERDSGGTVRIRRASDVDWPGMWPIWQAIVAAQETYMWDPYTQAEQARLLWFPDPPGETWVAVDDGVVVGSYLLRPNEPGPGAHVATASVMVAPAARGSGVGRHLAEHCLARARDGNYLAMQFNSVVTTNASAVGLWQSLGFDVIGTVPRAYQHRTHGLVDVHIMYRTL